MLVVEGLEAGYGKSQVLFGVGFEIRAGEAVTLLGRNGMGKTTTVLTLMGMLRAKAGSVAFEGTQVLGLPSYRVAQAGIGLVPEGRQIFPNLTVRENLVATAANRNRRDSPWNLDRIYTMFPRLAERKSQFGDQLSGGEQQMLAIARALMTNPSLLILDEATEGLAPLARKEIYAALDQLKRHGQSVLIIDKDLRALLGAADRHYILEKGHVVWSGTSAELASQKDVQHRFLGV